MSQALLDAAGPAGTIQVSFRIFPDHAEVDVLRSHPTLGSNPAIESMVSWLASESAEAAATADTPGARSPTGCPARCAGRD